jgi:DNA-binding transcriptional LysR family regulator
MLASKRDARVLVFKTGCSYRLRLEGFLAAHGLVHARRMDFGTLDGIVGCIEAGMGVSMLPRRVVEPLRQAGRISYHSLPDGAGFSQTLLVYRRDSLLTAAFRRFIDEAHDTFDPPTENGLELPVAIVGSQRRVHPTTDDAL